MILGVMELIAAASLLRGSRFGRYFGIVVACLVVIDALLDMPAAPFWSLAVIATTIWIIYGLATYHEARERPPSEVELGPETAPPISPRPLA